MRALVVAVRVSEESLAGQEADLVVLGEIHINLAVER